MSNAEEIKEAAHAVIDAYRVSVDYRDVFECHWVGSKDGVEIIEDSVHAPYVRLAKLIGRWSGDLEGHFTERAPRPESLEGEECPGTVADLAHAIAGYGLALAKAQDKEILDLMNEDGQRNGSL